MGNQSAAQKEELKAITRKFKISKSDVKVYQKLFKQHCPKGNHLSRKDFKSVYNQLFPGDCSEFADQMFRTFDTDGDGKVDFLEFLTGLCMTDSDDVNEKIEWAFKMYDVDGNGTISMDEVKKLSMAYYKMIYGYENQEESEVVAKELFQLMDKDNDEKITFQEFNDAAKKNSEILNMLFPSPQDEG